MTLRICILGSGSSGNCTYVASATTSILVDAGLSARQIAGRLAEIGVDPAGLGGICVSHEHNDHTAGLRVLNRRHGLPLFANSATMEAVRRNAKNRELPWNIFTTGVPFTIGDLTIEPFSVPHDAYDPVGFIVCNEEARVGIVTDIGVVTTLVRERLRRCHAVVLEANHDDNLLQEAPRPWHLKQRIRGRQGHLSNRHAADTLAEIAGPQLRHVFLAHLSEDCNREDLALKSAQASLTASGCDHVRVSVTFPDRISEEWVF